MKQLPAFDLASYKAMLEQLIGSGYHFYLIKELAHAKIDNQKCCFLRHDIDIHLHNIDQIANIEYALGIKSTYFILLTSLYNIFEPNNQLIINHILNQGHEIGLHYDLTQYPIHERNACEDKLKFEISILETVFKTKINSIVMHQPFTGLPDIFKQDSTYFHPHDTKWTSEMKYISDSCRAWRDESLLACYEKSGPRILQLNLHPELWLGNEINRIEFLNNSLFNNMKSSCESYKNNIESVWLTHEATLQHDKRTINA